MGRYDGVDVGGDWLTTKESLRGGEGDRVKMGL